MSSPFADKKFTFSKAHIKASISRPPPTITDIWDSIVYPISFVYSAYADESANEIFNDGSASMARFHRYINPHDAVASSSGHSMPGEEMLDECHSMLTSAASPGEPADGRYSMLSSAASPGERLPKKRYRNGCLRFEFYLSPVDV